ncbi:MAG: hypothetical protein ACRC6E_11570 [Fusobacteriaceae bacterium]
MKKTNWIQKLVCSHKTRYLGVARMGESFISDTLASVFVCDKCGKVFLQNKYKGDYDTTKITEPVAKVLDKYYKGER